MADVKHGLEERLQQWTEYESTFERIAEWLNECEATLKNFSHKNSLQEKQEQLERFQVIKTPCLVQLNTCMGL